MAAYRVRISETVLTILNECRKPKRFSELSRAVNVSETALLKNLGRLMEKGLIKKTKDGYYILTEEGEKVLEKIEIFNLIEKVVKEISVEEIRANILLSLRRKVKDRVMVLVPLYRALLCTRIICRYVEGLEKYLDEVNYLTGVIEEYLLSLFPKLFDHFYDSGISLRDLKKLSEEYIDDVDRLDRLLTYAENTISNIKEVKLEVLTESEKKIAKEAIQIIEQIKKELCTPPRVFETEP